MINKLHDSSSSSLSVLIIVCYVEIYRERFRQISGTHFEISQTENVYWWRIFRRSKWFNLMCDASGKSSWNRRGKGGNPRACQNQRDAGNHQSQVRPSYAKASVEGREEETLFGAHWCRRLIERAVARAFEIIQLGETEMQLELNDPPFPVIYINSLFYAYARWQID